MVLPSEPLGVNLALRDYQQEAVAALVRNVQGCAVVPCGGGKTVIGTAAAARIGQPTLVVVHTQDLVEQWRCACHDILGVEAGDIDGASPMVVVTVQSLASMSRDRLAEVGRRFGTVIVADAAKVASLCMRLRASDRVKPSVKEKTDDELLTHYGLAKGDVLTNLGVLLVGGTRDRAGLGSAPIVQAIKYDEREVKVAKWSWDNRDLSPIELIDAIWSEVPDFRESYELPDGLLRTKLPAYDELVVRELLVNALVHRPYTQRGDIYLNLHPDRLEVVNAGRLPLGVTPQNILHESKRRNDGLAHVFHDLKLMEREGSGIDLLFELLLASGRKVPTIIEGTDSVHVTVPRRVVQPGVIKLLVEADKRYQLTQRERITFAFVAQTESISAVELAEELELADASALRPWLGRLLTWGLIEQSGRTNATRYFVPPALLREAGLDALTTLTRVQPHRLRALILEDLERFPDSSKADIWRRVGPEIPERTFRRALEDLVASGRVVATGETRARKFNLQPGISGHGDDDGQ